MRKGKDLGKWRERRGEIYSRYPKRMRGVRGSYIASCRKTILLNACFCPFIQQYSLEWLGTEWVSRMFKGVALA